MYLLFYNISYTSYAFRIFNIPARTERRIKHTEAREDSRSPVKLQCSVRQRQGWAWTGGYSRLPGTLALRGQTLRPDRGGLRPRAPPQLPSPLLLLAEVEHSLPGGLGLSSPTHPLAPRFTALCTELRGVHSTTVAAVGGDAWFLYTAGWWEAGEPDSVINDISY